MEDGGQGSDRDACGAVRHDAERMPTPIPICLPGPCAACGLRLHIRGAFGHVSKLALQSSTSDPHHGSDHAREAQAEASVSRFFSPLSFLAKNGKSRNPNRRRRQLQRRPSPPPHHLVRSTSHPIPGSGSPWHPPLYKSGVACASSCNNRRLAPAPPAPARSPSDPSPPRPPYWLPSPSRLRRRKSRSSSARRQPVGPEAPVVRGRAEPM